MIEAHSQNTKVADKFHHKLYAYERQQKQDPDVVLYCVTQSAIIWVVVMVSEMHKVVTRYSLDMQIAKLPDTKEERQNPWYL